MNENIQKALWALIIVQLLICLFMTGRQVMNSNLRLWLNQDFFMFQKLQMMLGGDYVVAQQLSALPEDAGILIVNNDYWFTNYYLLPKRAYLYPGVNKESDLSGVPDKWIKGEGIVYVLVYGQKSLQLFTVGKDIKFK